MRYTLLNFISAIFIFILIIISCNGNVKSQPDTGKQKEESIPVEVTQVDSGNISAYFSGTATLEAEEEASVVARVSGIVIKIYVEEGDRIREGQELAKLDGEQLTLEVTQIESNLNKLHNDYKRNEKLLNKNLISVEIFENSKYEYLSQKAAYDLAKLKLDYTSIRAPIDGIVSERFIKVGNMLAENSPTFKITDFEPLLAIMHVPERELHKLHVNQPAELTADAIPDTNFSGNISRISPVVDPNTGTFDVTIEMSDPSGLLKPGMFGRVNIIYDRHQNILLVPKEAISLEDGESSVYVIKDSLAYRQVVQTGFVDEQHIEIVTGLNAGDTVVTTGQGSLKDSARVELIAYREE